jgi:GAF domain-containing protein
MERLLNSLFPLGGYTEAIDRRRAAGTYLISAMILGAVLIGLIGTLMVLAGGGTLNLLEWVRGGSLFVVGLAGVWLTRRGQQAYGAGLQLVAWFALIFFLMLADEVTVGAGFAGTLVGISLGTLLIGERTVIYTSFAALLFLIFGSANASPAEQRSAVLVLLPLGAIHAGLNFALARNFRLVTREITTDIQDRRMRLARTSADLVQRVLGARLDLPAVLEETVKLVRDNFPNLDEVQLFLIDKERKNAVLAATTNAELRANVGKVQIGVGSLSAIGRVTISGQTIIVRENGEELQYRRSGFLVGTRAELVIALRVGGEVIGALDAQSRNPSAFTPEDVESLETLANQIAVAIDNARLFTEMQDKLTDNRRLYEQATANLREIERLNQQLTGGAWTEYLGSMGRTPAFTIDLVAGRVENAAEVTPMLAEAIRRGQVVIRGAHNAKMIALPISVRGQVIGAMEFELALEQNIGAEQLAVLQQVVERLGLAAENIRLLDEAQRMAQREAMVNEITARMQAVTSVEAVVAAATQSLADAFQAPRVAIRLGMPTENGRASQ